MLVPWANKIDSYLTKLIRKKKGDSTIHNCIRKEKEATTTNSVQVYNSDLNTMNSFILINFLNETDKSPKQMNDQKHK